LPPPSPAEAHPWASRPAAHASIFLDRPLAGELTEAAKEGGRRGKEVLGLLLGDWLAAPGSGARYTVALAQATAPVQASATHVRFDPERFDTLARALEEQPFDYLIVGWFHTHLGLGCFLSETDLHTQERYFRLPHQFALVFDPLRKEAAAYTFEAQSGAGVPFAVFENGAGATPDYRKSR